MASKYGHEHRKVRAQYQRLIDAGQGWCAEPICLMPSREIPPGSGPDDWHVCHDPSGTRIIGPGHARCNESEAAKRGNAMRKPTTDVTILTWSSQELKAVILAIPSIYSPYGQNTNP